MWPRGPDQTSSGCTQTHKALFTLGSIKEASTPVPNSTLPAVPPPPVLLSFAAGQILTFFHSAGQWNREQSNRWLLAASFLWEAEPAGRLAARSSSHPRRVKKAEPVLRIRRLSFGLCLDSIAKPTWFLLMFWLPCHCRVACLG